jgi:tetratricopeptide (TPR) repeat protein
MKILSVTISDSRGSEIEDALRSVVVHVDGCLLVDTGIKDDTLERARAVAGDRLVVAEHRWQDFSSARNFALEEASRLGAQWGVMLDTDERYEGDIRAAIEAAGDAEVLLVEAADGSYVKEKIFRLPSVARYVGPTHEVPLGGSRAPALGLVFHELGKSHEQLAHKRQRDADLLARHTAEHPDDPRWWYYLGDALEGLGRNDEAVAAFSACERLRGWDEEAAWACYRSASILVGQSRYRDAVDFAARGIAAHAGVAELYWIAALASFRMGATDKAIYWARLSATVGNWDIKRIGFRHLPAMHELPYDILRHALPSEEAEEDFWRAKERRYGASVQEAALSRAIHPGLREEARNDLGSRSTKLPASIVEIDAPAVEGWNRLNPCIFNVEDGLECVVRTVNYKILDGGGYEIPGGIVQTRNYLADVDRETLRLLNVREIIDHTRVLTSPSWILGYEDIRVVAPGGRRLLSATVCDRREDMRRQIVSCELAADGFLIGEQAVYESDRDEKNWMPTPDGKAFVYSCGATAIQERDGDGYSEHESTLGLEHLRGGSQLLAVEDGFLAVVHEVIYTGGKRVYLHHFVRFDESYRIASVSDAWYLEKIGIEFCCGMARRGSDLILSFGIDDRRAVFAVLAEADALRLAGRHKAL